ncbi:dicarboxylate/amino acid:cation symporter [Legionella sp. W05-934-2]|uniref:dicarboxylate/amino acid:cation symporter n=1 Tax=Legionella sp. W05-934-2 TaxID=1198649 RepID=UPI003462CC2C
MDLNSSKALSLHIIIAILLGLVVGVLLHYGQPQLGLAYDFFYNTFDFGGKAFINILKMLVVPVVFVSLICGTLNLKNASTFGRAALKTIVLYLLTTALAITIALSLALLTGVGKGGEKVKIATDNVLQIQAPESVKDTLLSLIPSNPIAAMAQGNMIQIIIFALLFGLAINRVGEKAQRFRKIFQEADLVVMSLVSLIFRVAPYGIFCLVASLFAQTGLYILVELATYFMVVVFGLVIHFVLIYMTMLKCLAGLSPIHFVKQMWPAMLFAFSTSSSNASIPVVMDTVHRRLGVSESISSFVIPLGATINMDGTAIMQGVATVFIANSYQIPLTFVDYLTVVMVATMASIGTAGVPGVGLITLVMVLKQVGLPAEGVALIIGIDRLLDMLRTTVNISGDATVACVVAHSESALNKEKFYAEQPLDAVESFK